MRVAIITGAGGGIGAATARRLAHSGWHVVVVGRRVSPLTAIAAEIGGLALPADVGDPVDAKRVIEHVDAAYGRLDGLVLNAGIARPGRVADVSDEDWRASLATNLTGPFLMTRAALPRLIESGGAVVAVASIGARVAGEGSAAYGASKAGLERLMASVAVDYGADGVRANTVNPGWTRTELADAEMGELGGTSDAELQATYDRVTEHVPARRAAWPDEVASAIEWLLSSDAAYVNGAALSVDGGATAVSAGMLAFQGARSQRAMSPARERSGG